MSAAEPIAIAGLGLMGGSLALALKAGGFASPIIGISRREETRAAALAAGAVDAVTPDLAEAASRAAVVVLATPVRTILRQIAGVGRSVRPGSLVTDLGSTKAEVCRTLAALPEGVHAVGGHPMCGKETAGFGAADPELYRGKTWVLCPVRGRDGRARAIAELAGARVVELDPAVHDRAVAAISHLPYAAAVALVNTVAESDGPQASLAASGFRDTSRLAGSDVEMMLDVLLTNRDAVLDWLERYAAELAALRGALDSGDEQGLRSLLSAAREGRGRFVAQPAAGTGDAPTGSAPGSS